MMLCPFSKVKENMVVQPMVKFESKHHLIFESIEFVTSYSGSGGRCPWVNHGYILLLSGVSNACWAIQKHPVLWCAELFGSYNATGCSPWADFTQSLTLRSTAMVQYTQIIRGIKYFYGLIYSFFIFVFILPQIINMTSTLWEEKLKRKKKFATSLSKHLECYAQRELGAKLGRYTSWFQKHLQNRLFEDVALCVDR